MVRPLKAMNILHQKMGELLAKLKPAAQRRMSWLSEIGGRRLPFLRWSVWRMAFGARNLLTNWQVGDGREEALARHVAAHARKGDLDDVIRAIDDFCYRRAIMMNVGDEKGAILDRAIARARRGGCSSSAPTAATARSGWRA